MSEQLYGHTPCHDPKHGPTCEGNELHVRARDAKGCAQMQDGSWITKASFVCQGPHPGLGPRAGMAAAVLALIEGDLREGTG